jgi:hypothetical protein
MAPEQIKGKDIDARADLFAFGSVLFEMLSGRKAFEADSNASVMAAILEREPPALSSVQPLVPPALDRLLMTCLAKDPDDRWQTARDLLRELQWVASADSNAGDTRKVHRPLRRPRLTAALVLVGVAAVSGLSYLAGVRKASSPTTPVRVARLTDFLGLEEYPAISPDGRSVAFTADEGGTRQIWVKLIAGGAPLQLTRDRTDHLRPRWSPDSSSVVFFSPPASGEPSGTLWEVSALGGAPRRIADSVADADVSHDGTRLAFIRHADSRRCEHQGHRGIGRRLFLRLASLVAGRWADRIPTKQDEPRRRGVCRAGRRRRTPRDYPGQQSDERVHLVTGRIGHRRELVAREQPVLLALV